MYFNEVVTRLPERAVSETSVITPAEEIDFVYDIQKTVKWIEDNGAAKVCLQFPDSLLGDSVAVCKKLKTLSNKEVYILADTSYNSCCVDEVAAQHISADAILHYGHSCLSPCSPRVLHVYPKAALDLPRAVETLKEAAQKTDGQMVLFYNVSLEHISGDLCHRVFEALPGILIGVISKEKDITYNGRLIVNKDGVPQKPEVLRDCHLVFLGEEGPTLFNLAISTQVRQLSLLSCSDCSCGVYNESPWFKRRRFVLEQCRDARSIAILVCTLSITDFRLIISRMKKLIKAGNRKCYTLTVGKPNIAKLANLPEIDVFVLVACPENELYSSRDFMKPIVYPYELEMALNTERDQFSMEYTTNFVDLLPNGKNYCDISLSEVPDVSLITGKLRVHKEADVVEVNGGTHEVVKRDECTVAELSIGDGMSSRTWRGLEQQLGSTAVGGVQVGRRGIASGYETEPAS